MYLLKLKEICINHSIDLRIISEEFVYLVLMFTHPCLSLNKQHKMYIFC